MKICLIEYSGSYRYCIYQEGKYYEMAPMLNMQEDELVREFYNLYDKIINLKLDDKYAIKPETIKYGVPIPGMRSVRDFYAFEDHVKNARKNKGLDMIKEWYDFPVFYFSCTPNVYPSGYKIKYPEKSKAFDYEMEVAAVIGNRTLDCHENCMDAIFGFITMNDWSLRDIQKEELFGLKAFDGKYSLLYHKYDPAEIEKTSVEYREKLSSVDLVEHRHIKTGMLGKLNNFYTGRQTLFYNESTSTGIIDTDTSPDTYFRNALCDEVFYVQSGKGSIESPFGTLKFRKGDFIYIPRGTTYRAVMDERSFFFFTISSDHMDIPAHYMNKYGQIKEGMP